MRITLPFPPALLLGHNTGHWRKKAPIVENHRHAAIVQTLAVRLQWTGGLLSEEDIFISITFHPPDRRGDRVNYPNRMKPYLDGIAEALGVNDRRFLPSYHFAEPCKDARVVVVIEESSVA